MNPEQKQQIFNILSGLESALFHIKNREPDAGKKAELIAVHADIKTALEKWHNLTGCVLQ